MNHVLVRYVTITTVPIFYGCRMFLVPACLEFYMPLNRCTMPAAVDKIIKARLAHIIPAESVLINRINTFQI